MKRGIDVSEWQDRINWDRVKAENEWLDFVIVRGGYGMKFDSEAKRNLSECNRLGIPCGIYWFSYADNEREAVEEANLALSLAKNFKIEYPIYFDFEYDSKRNAEESGTAVTPDFVTKVTEAFCETIEKGGYYTGIYTNLDWLENFYTDDELLHKYDIWLAEWGTDEPIMYVNLWQDSSSWTVNGISGAVDSNVDFVDLKSVIKNAGLNHLERCPTCGRLL